MWNSHARETLGLDMISFLKQTFTCRNCFHTCLTCLSHAFIVSMMPFTCFFSGSEVTRKGPVYSLLLFVITLNFNVVKVAYCPS